MNPSGNYAELLLRMLFYLAVVVAVLWFGGRWVLPRLYKSRFGPARRMGILDQVVIAPGKSIAIVKVLERYYLVGIADGGVRLLTEMSRQEVEAGYAREVATAGGSPAATPSAQDSPESRQEWGRKE
ncbi:MAG: flagellar biosynthetic protein FliO [Candidatus Eisenbacteria bacterium]